MTLRACMIAVGRVLGLALLVTCGRYPAYDPPIPPRPWTVPAGWRHDRAALPVAVTTVLGHRGMEERRLAPEDPWSLAIAWSLDGYPAFESNAIAGVLTAYLGQRLPGWTITVDASSKYPGPTVRVALTIHLIDPAHDAPIVLEGTGRQSACRDGGLWVFTWSPAGSPVRPGLAALSRSKTCDQPPFDEASSSAR